MSDLDGIAKVLPLTELIATSLSPLRVSWGTHLVTQLKLPGSCSHRLIIWLRSKAE